MVALPPSIIGGILHLWAALASPGGLPGVIQVGEPQAVRPDPQPPETILFNGRVYTGDPKERSVEALGIRGGVVQARGDSRTILALAGKETRKVDLEGRFVYPGFVDAHGHMSSLGRTRRSLDLVGTSSFEEVAARLAARTRTTPHGEWIIGRGWDQNDWETKAFPRHDPLTREAPHHPVWLVRVGGHAGIANEAALRVAGITRETEDPPGGRILRDPKTGEPTGVLIDEAMALLTRKLPKRSTRQIREEILEAQRACLAAGLTEVHDAGVDEAEIGVYKALDKEGLLKIRIYGMASGDLESLSRIFADPPIIPDPDRRFTLRAVKVYADGALGSRGAALLEAYSDDPGNRGLLTITREDLQRLVEWALGLGLQVCTHAIGDGATRVTLDVYEGALKGKDADRYRLRVEHAQVIAPDDIPRFHRLGVIPSMQPTHCTSDMPWAGDRLGPVRLAGAYAWRSLLKAGSPIAAGSDFPVESHNPLWGIYAAVTRQDHQGRPEVGWAPEQRMTREEALAAFSAAGAFASFEEKSKGTLSPGLWADLVVLEGDILTIPVREIPSTAVWATMVGGEIVYQAPP